MSELPRAVQAARAGRSVKAPDLSSPYRGPEDMPGVRRMRRSSLQFLMVYSPILAFLIFFFVGIPAFVDEVRREAAIDPTIKEDVLFLKDYIPDTYPGEALGLAALIILLLGVLAYRVPQDRARRRKRSWRWNEAENAWTWHDPSGEWQYATWQSKSAATWLRRLLSVGIPLSVISGIPTMLQSGVPVVAAAATPLALIYVYRHVPTSFSPEYHYVQCQFCWKIRMQPAPPRCVCGRKALPGSIGLVPAVRRRWSSV